MYKGLIVTDDAKIQAECEKIIRDSGHIYLGSIKSPSEVRIGDLLNYLFILVTEYEAVLFDKIAELQKRNLGLNLIFYNHSLNFSVFSKFKQSSKINLIIGENRKASLSDMLDGIKENYWRKLPYQKFGIQLGSLSPRMRLAMHYVESAPIAECNISSLSSYLRISAGYFSQEFKRETHKSFRSFMQAVLDHYENLIFLQTNLPAKEISHILGYSELSSFSRSFKKRKGISPANYKKLVNSGMI